MVFAVVFRRKWHTEYPVEDIQVLGPENLSFLGIAVHNDRGGHAENHYISSLDLQYWRAEPGVGHACEETLDGSGKAVQGYLGSPAFLLDKQCQTRRERAKYNEWSTALLEGSKKEACPSPCRCAIH